MQRQPKNNLTPKNLIRGGLLKQNVSVRTNAPTPTTKQQPPQPAEKPIRQVVEAMPKTIAESRIGRLHIIMTCVNYSDFLVISLAENTKIIDPKFITVITDSNDKLTQEVCRVYGVNCVITDRFYEDNAVFNKGKAINEGIKTIQNPDWILITDADIVFPSDFMSILNNKTVNKNKLYAASRYLCNTYEKYEKYKNKKISLNQLDGVHQCPPVGYFQLFSYDNLGLTDKQTIYPEISKDASWSDMLFADKFPQKECIADIKLIHLGPDGQNWKGRKTKRFITDEIFESIITKYEYKPFVISPRKKSKEHKLAVITSFFNPANYNNIKHNYTTFKEHIKNSGVDLFTIELAFNNQEFFTEESPYNIRIRGDENNIMWQKERLLNILLDYIPEEYDNIAWIDCDVIFDNPMWVTETNEKLEKFKMLQLFESGHFYEEYNNIVRVSDGIIKHLHIQKTNLNINFYPTYGGTPGLAWAIRRECIQDIKFMYKMIIGGGDSVMMLAGIGCFNDQFIYQNMNPKLFSQTLVWSNKFYQEIKKSMFYVSGSAYHLYHGTNTKRNYNFRMECLNNNEYNPNQDIKIGKNQLLEWSSDKPQLHKCVNQYFFDRDEDDNLYSLNHYFDGIFCINLDRQPEKWNKISEQFNKYKITVERVRAFDGSWDIIKNEWNDVRTKLIEKYGDKMSNPSAYGLLENEYAYGTLCSHIQIIKIAKQRKLKNILILEDDILFHNNFKYEISKILNYTDWKLLYLGASQHRWDNITLQNGYYTPKITLGGFAYALDSSVYDEVLDLALLCEKSFDNCLGNFDGNDIQSKHPQNCYVIYPNLIIADVRDSNLREKRDLESHAIKMKWNLNLYNI